MPVILPLEVNFEIGVTICTRMYVCDEWILPMAKEQKASVKKDASLVTSGDETGNVSHDIDDCIRMLRYDLGAGHGL